ncbi:UbiA family prenyltransferase [Candidatus Parcubacteria bacterium]|nr:UbiA family prenyltransferase [Candidatus Parcubacteria bacterium]
MLSIIRNLWFFKKDLLVISRLHTFLYAFIVAIVGHKFTEITNWKIVLLNAFLFAVIASSIMIFNDIIDRESDFIRGKTFAFHQYKIVFVLWLIISAVALILAIILCFISFKVSLFCLSIWIIGITYSYLQKIYIIQNMLVSLCSASPVLSGAIYQKNINIDIWLIFISLCLVILSREILKDAQHKKSDIGHKTTIPIQTENKYSDTVSYVNFHPASILIPKSTKEKIDIKLKGEYMETHKVISSLFSYAPLFLIPVLGWLVLLPTIFLAMASVCTFVWLISGEHEINKWMSMAKTSSSFGIFFIPVLLLIK